MLLEQLQAEMLACGRLQLCLLLVVQEEEMGSGCELQGAFGALMPPVLLVLQSQEAAEVLPKVLAGHPR